MSGVHMVRGERGVQRPFCLAGDFYLTLGADRNPVFREGRVLIGVSGYRGYNFVKRT